MVRFVIDSRQSKAAAARQFNTKAKTVAKWVRCGWLARSLIETSFIAKPNGARTGWPRRTARGHEMAGGDALGLSDR
jgi:hypothetical protein